MSETPASLLNRLREAAPDGSAWRQFDAIYRPLLTRWLHRYSLQPHDADDVVQEILQSAASELTHFHYDPARGHFRGWLRQVMVNRLREFWRREARPGLRRTSARGAARSRQRPEQALGPRTRPARPESATGPARTRLHAADLAGLSTVDGRGRAEGGRRRTRPVRERRFPRQVAHPQAVPRGRQGHDRLTPTFECAFGIRTPRTHEYVRPGLYFGRPRGSKDTRPQPAGEPASGDCNKAPGERTRESGVLFQDRF